MAWQWQVHDLDKTVTPQKTLHSSHWHASYWMSFLGILEKNYGIVKMFDCVMLSVPFWGLLLCHIYPPDVMHYQAVPLCGVLQLPPDVILVQTEASHLVKAKYPSAVFCETAIASLIVDLLSIDQWSLNKNFCLKKILYIYSLPAMVMCVQV